MTAPVGYAIFSTYYSLNDTLTTLPVAIRFATEARLSFNRYLKAIMCERLPSYKYTRQFFGIKTFLPLNYQLTD